MSITQRTDESDAVVQAVGVSQSYRLPRRKIFAPHPMIDAVQEIDLSISRGTATGIVGESGAGKSTLTRILVGDEKPAGGRLLFRGDDLWSSSPAVRREFQRSVQIVLQNPRSSFDPRMRMRTSLFEPLRALKIAGNHSTRVSEVIDQVGLREEVLDRYPHELSGGQLQRIAIARALLPSPEVLIADEPVSALDVSIQAQVLNLLKDLVSELSLALVLIAHDLSVVAYTTSEAVVLSAGRIVDRGRPLELFQRPQADETRALVDSVLTVSDGLAGIGLR